MSYEYGEYAIAHSLPDSGPRLDRQLFCNPL